MFTFLFNHWCCDRDERIIFSSWLLSAHFQNSGIVRGSGGGSGGRKGRWGGVFIGEVLKKHLSNNGSSNHPSPEYKSLSGKKDESEWFKEAVLLSLGRQKGRMDFSCMQLGASSAVWSHLEAWSQQRTHGRCQALAMKNCHSAAQCSIM